MNPGYIVIAIIILIFLFIALFGKGRKKEESGGGRVKSANDIYREAAEMLGVRFIKGGVLSAPRILGDVEGMTVTAGTKLLSMGGNQIAVFERGVRYEFECDGILEIVSGGDEMYAGTAFSERLAVSCGDDAFDSVMTIYYSKTPSCAIALLDSRLRSAILDLKKNAGILLVSRHGIHIYNREGCGDPAEIALVIRNIVDVAKIVLENSDFRRMHIENIRSDPVPAVRLKNIRMLLSHYPLDGEISRLLDACMEDPDVLMQFEAAKYLKARGFEHIIRLVREKKITKVKLIIEAVDAMGDGAYRDAAPFLMELFEAVTNTDLRTAILATAKKLGAAPLSPFLVSLLKGRGDDTRDLAIDALSTCGTVESVEKLLKLSEDSMNPFLKNRIGETVAAIQARLGDVEKGWLSEVAITGKEGALSKADGADEGALSKMEDEKGKK